MTDSERLQIMADTYKRSGEIYKEVMVTPEGYEALLHAIKILNREEHLHAVGETRNEQDI